MNREDEVRRLAHQIWEAEGGPEGRHEEHWVQAEAMWEERNASSSADPAPAPAKVARPKRKAATPRVRRPKAKAK